MNKACFLDRDGVINVEKNYLHDPAEVELESGIVEALALLHAHGYLALVVTNQAGVAKGMYDESAVARVHQRIRELLAARGVAVDAFFYCPHHPDFTGPCSCRKPAPGMLLTAAAQFQVDPGASLMIGDRTSDVLAGLAAGCRRAYLVATGYGPQAELPALPGAERADHALDAVKRFLTLTGELPAAEGGSGY